MRALPLLLVVPLLAPLALAGNAYDAPDAGDATGWNTQRKMARAADGSLYATFLAAAPDGRSTEVAVVRVSPEGEVSELPRPSAARGDASRSTLALDASGALHVAWTERAEDDREVFHAVWRDGAWRDAQQLSGGLGYAGFPSLAADARGRMHVAWYGFDGTHYQAFYRRWVEGAWEPAQQLSSGALDANNPSALVDAEDRAHVAWYKDDGHRYRIWHAVREPEGAFALPRGLPAATDAEVDAYNAALALDAQGRVHAVWDEKHPDGYWVAHATWDAERGWATPDVLARGAQGGEYPAIAAWRDGVLVAWEDANGTLVGTDLSGAPTPLLGGGVSGRNPSLRGALLLPESERARSLDLMAARPLSDGGWSVQHVALPEECSPFEPLEACEGSAGWRRLDAAAADARGGGETRPAPASGALALLVSLGVAACVATAARARR